MSENKGKSGNSIHTKKEDISKNKTVERGKVESEDDGWRGGGGDGEEEGEGEGEEV